MPRGFFTQSTTVLFSQAPSIDAIEEALAPLGASITRRETEPGWLSGGTELLVPFGESPAGTLHVDVVDQAWPDGMGHPEEAADLFGAWTMGAFGPLAFPNNLARAAQQAVAFPGAKEAVAGHGAFVRLRTSYLVGAGPDAPIMPEGWSPLAEIDAMLQIVRPLELLGFGIRDIGQGAAYIERMLDLLDEDPEPKACGPGAPDADHAHV